MIDTKPVLSAKEKFDIMMDLSDKAEAAFASRRAADAIDDFVSDIVQCVRGSYDEKSSYQTYLIQVRYDDIIRYQKTGKKEMSEVLPFEKFWRRYLSGNPVVYIPEYNNELPVQEDPGNLSYFDRAVKQLETHIRWDHLDETYPWVKRAQKAVRRIIKEEIKDERAQRKILQPLLTEKHKDAKYIDLDSIYEEWQAEKNSTSKFQL